MSSVSRSSLCRSGRLQNALAFQSPVPCNYIIELYISILATLFVLISSVNDILFYSRYFIVAVHSATLRAANAADSGFGSLAKFAATLKAGVPVTQIAFARKNYGHTILSNRAIC